jgi:UDP-glucose 4-epimerase
MKILITGGAGFIGSHIVDAYIAQGHSVAVIDNLSTGFRRNVNKKAKFYKADITDIKAVQRIVAQVQPQVVNHQAALVEVIRSLRDPLPTLIVNTLGTANILTAFGTLSKAKNKKFLFASTGGAIYGEPKKLPADEKTFPMPLSAYGLSKHMAEEEIRFLSKQFDFEYLIFRYANVYGPRQNPKGEAGVVAIFGGLLKHGEQPIIFGDGKKTRDYMFVSDIVRANVLGLKKGKNIEINLGWGRHVSDREVFDRVAEFYGYGKPPRFLPHRAGEVRHITLNASKAEKELGWAPKVPFEKGVRQTLDTI